MSRHHHKNLQRGISSSLVDQQQRVRTERHGKPHTVRRWSRAEEIVAPGTPGAKRTVEERDPAVVYPDGTVEVDGLVVVYRKLVDRSKQVPVTEPYKLRVAQGPTGKYGQKQNAPPTKGAAKPSKPAK